MRSYGATMRATRPLFEDERSLQPLRSCNCRMTNGRVAACFAPLLDGAAAATAACQRNVTTLLESVEIFLNFTFIVLASK